MDVPQNHNDRRSRRAEDEHSGEGEAEGLCMMVYFMMVLILSGWES